MIGWQEAEHARPPGGGACAASPEAARDILRVTSAPHPRWRTTADVTVAPLWCTAVGGHARAGGVPAYATGRTDNRARAGRRQAYHRSRGQPGRLTSSQPRG